MKKTMMLLLMSVMPIFAQNEIPLWNENMPGLGATQQEIHDAQKEPGVLRVTNVSVPTLQLYPAPDTKTPAPMVIVCPGGGYRILAYDKEGTEVAEWLNSIGVSAAVLKYRVPGNRSGALEDAQRAVRLVREKANDLNIDPERIGMIGFSAGAHLTAVCSNSPDRPNFSMLIYPAYLFKTGGIELTDEINIDAMTPPAFIVQAQNDKKFYRSTLAYAAALDAKGIPVEVHLFAKGGHGFGLRPSKHPVCNWPALCVAWLHESGILSKKSSME